jgi:hypothetical protein
MAQFLDPGLDFGREDLSPDEATRYLDWCRRVHGEGNLDLVPFAEFFAELDGAGLKRLRRHTAQLALPTAAAVLMWTHTYCVQGFAKGVLYEVIAARELGISRAALVEVLKIAGYFGGPRALNAAGELTLPYLRRWEESETADMMWPAGWTIDPDAFRTGIDHSTAELTSNELELIERWYVRVHGSMPESMHLAAQANPGAFKMNRVRFERLPGVAIPAQLVPLLGLHTAAANGWTSGIRRSFELARFVGVDQSAALTTLHWATVVGGEWLLSDAFEALADVHEPEQGASTKDRALW